MNKKNEQLAPELLRPTFGRRKFIKTSCFGVTGVLGLSTSSVLLSNTATASINEIRITAPANPGTDDETAALQQAINDANSNDIIVLANRRHFITSTLIVDKSDIRIRGEGENSEIYIERPLDKDRQDESALYIRPTISEGETEAPSALSNIVISNLTLSSRKVPEGKKGVPAEDGTENTYFPPVPFIARGVQNSRFEDLRIVGGFHGWLYGEIGYKEDNGLYGKIVDQEDNGTKHYIFCGGNTIKRVSFINCCLWAFYIRSNRLVNNVKTYVSDIIIRNCNVGLVVSNELEGRGVKDMNFKRIHSTQCDTPLHIEVAQNIEITNSVFRAFGPVDSKWESCLNGVSNDDLTSTSGLDLWPANIVITGYDSNGDPEFLAPFKGDLLISNTENVTFNNCELSPRIVSKNIIGNAPVPAHNDELNRNINCWTNNAHPVKNLKFIDCKINGTVSMSAQSGTKDDVNATQNFFGTITFKGCGFGEQTHPVIDHVKVADVGQTWIEHLIIDNCTLHGAVYTSRTKNMTVTGGEWNIAMTQGIGKDDTCVQNFELDNTKLHLSKTFNNTYIDNSAAVNLSGTCIVDGIDVQASSTSIIFKPDHINSTNEDSLNLNTKDFGNGSIDIETGSLFV